VRAEREIICKDLRWGRRRLRARGFVVSRVSKLIPGGPRAIQRYTQLTTAQLTVVYDRTHRRAP